jgi:hypothetical protein
MKPDWAGLEDPAISHGPDEDIDYDQEEERDNDMAQWLEDRAEARELYAE